MFKEIKAEKQLNGQQNENTDTVNVSVSVLFIVMQTPSLETIKNLRIIPT